MFSTSVNDFAKKHCEAHLTLYPELNNKLYKDIETVKSELVSKNVCDYYGGTDILQKDEKVFLIMDLWNLTIVLCHMQDVNNPKYQIRKTLDNMRDELWKFIYYGF
jgi:hypothetical protein